MEAGGAVRVEEAGFGDKNGLRVKYGGLKEVMREEELGSNSISAQPTIQHNTI